MARTLALDVYGTLVDPLGIRLALEPLLGAEAPAFAAAWRDKQLEYLFRRGLGRDYAPFAVCTEEALDYTCSARGLALAGARRARLLAAYRALPAYPDVRPALERIHRAGDRAFAFSNGDPDDLAELLSAAGIAELLAGIVSVQAVRSFKPDPAVYAHFLAAAGAAADDTWLVSGNAFDIIGAHRQGWRTAWLRRDGAAPFDPWGIEPDVTIGDLGGLLAPGA